MSDPNHPIFKQFTELDPSMVVIRDTPHPDWVWNQPPIMGTLTPGYAQRMPEQPHAPAGNESRIPFTNNSQVQARPQRWQPDFPGLWDDIPGSGTTRTHDGSTSSNMSHTRPYSYPQPVPPLSMGHSQGLAGSAGHLPERQDRQRCDNRDERITDQKPHRL
ncbi:unnamed protein product [Rhizoctonia solani]|uniref:Uncharacterized protein n=1 Tax=Rhizoctonia solani TaxID=456999 RepID=A0A8H2XWU3_9AGAM|nr:unnamed protein product [Rhizoctonia solani]